MSTHAKQYRDNEDTITSIPFNPAYPCVGRIVGTTNAGGALVAFDGHEPKIARLLTGLNSNERITNKHMGREVLLVFEQGNPNYPVIVGLMAEVQEDTFSRLLNTQRQLTRDKNKINESCLTIEAEQEIVLKCGLGSITIRNDGKIVIKGTDLLARSKGVNRIKGATVRIN